MNIRRPHLRSRLDCRPTLAALSLLVLTSFAPSVRAAPTVSISPGVVSVNSVGDFNVSVLANIDVGPLSCFALSVSFDPTYLELISTGEGALFTAAVDPTFFSQDVDDNGKDRVSDCVLGFGTSVLPAGELAVLTFRPIVGGTTQIDLLDVTLRDVNRAVIAGVVAQPASVVIDATSTPGVQLARVARLSIEPNPSSGVVSIRWVAPTESGVHAKSAGSAVELVLYDLAGREVRRLRTAHAASGLRWDGRDAVGRPVAAGIYFAVMSSSDGSTAHAKLVRID